MILENELNIKHVSIELKEFTQGSQVIRQFVNTGEYDVFVGYIPEGGYKIRPFAVVRSNESVIVEDGYI